jgi:putative ABC transport system permease protein
MPRMPGIRRLLHIVGGRASIARAVDDELRFHFDMTVKELTMQGMNPDDARREAERRFGDVARTRARLTHIDRARADQERRAEWWNAFAQDLRYALRGLRLKPAFAAGVVLTLGLGIGANAAMFGIVDRLLFRPPAYLVAPDRVHRVYLGRVVNGKEFVGSGAAYQRYLDFAKTSRTMEQFAAYSQRRMVVGVGEAARELHIGAMTASMWQFFDAKPVVGRFFTAEEDRDPGAARVVVLAYRYWESEYGGRRDVIGTTVNIGPSTYTIIGVAPKRFSAADVIPPIAFIPITAAAEDGFSAIWAKYRKTYNISWLEIFARRKPGVSMEAANADLTESYRQSWIAHQALSPRLDSLRIAKPRAIAASALATRGPELSADTKVAAWLLGVASIVLLIACANVGNLLLARAFKRRREIAVRIALGVGRVRLLGQLLIESLLLATLGAVAGLLVAQWGGQILRVMLMPKAEWEAALADQRVLLFAGGTALLAGLLAGLAPIFYAGRSDVAAALKTGARDGHGRKSRVRTMLLVAQAALSVILLVGAGLFIRSLQNIQTVHLGYDADRIAWLEPHLRGVKLDSATSAALWQTMIERAEANPNVESATLALSIPFSSTYSDDVFVPGIDSTQKLGDFVQQGASLNFFKTTGTRIVSGRGFTADDRATGPKVIVVSESMARAFWPNESPIGKCVKISADTMPCRSVVGVAENIVFGGFANDTQDHVYYLPTTQLGNQFYTLLLRVRGDPAGKLESLRRELVPVLPTGGYFTATTLSEVLAPATRSWRLGATMFAVFGGLALVLATIGLYSVVAYSVTQRTHEMGVRIALGARVADVVRLIVRDGVGVVLVGVVIGSVIALFASGSLAPLLFKTSPHDPLVFAGVATALVIIAVAASWIPALRASRVDPSAALRAD